MRSYFIGLCLLTAIACVGCDKTTESPIDTSDPIPPLMKALESPSELAQSAATSRLGEFGDQARPAIPALQKLARRNPRMKGKVDEAIGKIEGRIPLKGSPAS